MKHVFIFLGILGLLAFTFGILLMAEKKLAQSRLKYQDAAELKQMNDKMLVQIQADQTQALKLLISINNKLERRIGDGPQIGEAPK